jgi:hypothetical protein
LQGSCTTSNWFNFNAWCVVWTWPDIWLMPGEWSTSSEISTCMTELWYYASHNYSILNWTCWTTNNSCTSWTLSDTADSSTQYLWSCNWINGWTTTSCSLNIPIDWICWTEINSCDVWTFSEGFSYGLWVCNWLYGWSDVGCSTVDNSLPELRIICWWTVGCPEPSESGMLDMWWVWSGFVVAPENAK